MKFRQLPRSLLVASIGAAFAVAAKADLGDLPAPELKLSRELEPPVKRTPAQSPG